MEVPESGFVIRWKQIILSEKVNFYYSIFKERFVVMSKKTRNLVITAVIVVIVAIVAVVGYHMYQESQKSSVEKGMVKAVRETEKAGAKAADWTDKNVSKAAKETKKFLKK